MAKKILMALVVLAFAVAACKTGKEPTKPDAAAPAAGQDEKVKGAIKIAEQWLALTDAGTYPQAYAEAADPIKKAVSPEQWDQVMKSSRGPFGPLVSRKVQTAQYVTSIPGAPDGQYVVIIFETAFENKKTAVETVTPMLEPDGKWRVSGYYIK